MHPSGSSPSPSPFGLSPLPFLLTLNTQLSDPGFDFDSSSWLFPPYSPPPPPPLSSSSSMDFSKVGEKILTSVLSARSFSLLPSSSHRPQVPARAAAAAAVARALATLTPDQRVGLPSSSAELSSIYGSQTQCPVVEDLEDCFYEEDFDPILFVLENVPSDEDELEYFENKATVRLAQLEKISERLSRHVMEHYEEMVKGMQLVRELERDLKIATVICMNGRRHLTSSMNEVSRDLIVTTNSRKKQALLDLLPVLTELRYALNTQKELDSLVGEGNFFKAFQVLPEYLQLLDTRLDLLAVQEMSRSVEDWLENTLQKLDSLLLEVCQVFREEKYITVVDAYALIGDVSGLAEKIQSYFMQEVLSESHSALKTALQEDQDEHSLQISSKLTYSDLCFQIPESKFRQCLLSTLAALFRLMCSYYAIMSFHPENKVLVSLKQDNTDKQCVPQRAEQGGQMNGSETAVVKLNSMSSGGEGDTKTSAAFETALMDSDDVSDRSLDASVASSSGSPWYELRRDAAAVVSQSLQRGRKNLWQLTVSRVSVLLSSSAFSSTSMHQFLRNYEDLNVFALAGEAFCGTEATEFRNKLMSACQNYYINFHKQNIHALKIVLERECWQQLPPDAVDAVSFAGLVGDGAPFFASDVNSMNDQLPYSPGLGSRKNGFSFWLTGGNPFLPKASSPTYRHIQSSAFSTLTSSSREHDGDSQNGNSLSSSSKDIVNHTNGNTAISEDENEDLLADFIDEDSQLPSRISKTSLSRNHSSQWRDDEATTQTGSSLCLLRFMDKYARLMQKLGMINVELFKGLCQLFELYYYFLYETFSHQDIHANNKGVIESLNYRLKTAINKITQDCEQWLKPGVLMSSSSTSLNTPNKHVEPTPTVPPGCSFGLKERSTAVDTISLVARVLLRSKPHLQSMLLQNNPAVVEDFYVNLVDSVPDLVMYIHRTTAKSLLHINGYSDRIANAKWEVKELGMEHNGYVDLLLGEFKHYKTRLAHAGIRKEVQDLLLEYGVEIVAQTLVEGLSRVKRCTDEGRALMSLDLQVLINGLQHFVSKDVKPKLTIVETFIKAYYLPETEYVHWARSHPEYNKNQVVGLVNLVAAMKGWRRKTRLEILEKIE